MTGLSIPRTTVTPGIAISSFLMGRAETQARFSVIAILALGDLR